MQALGPHDTFMLFKHHWPFERHSLSYFGHSDDFPIGYIGGGLINADQARRVVEENLEDRFGPIMHLALAPHPTHDIVHFSSEVPASSTTFTGDALIVPKHRRFAIETFVGDCAVIVTATENWLGFIHCGAPELFDNLLEAFFKKWPDPHETHVFIGPCISGRWYAYNPEKVPDKYKTFIIGPEENDNAFDDCYTFAVNLAIERELQSWQTASLSNCGVDPFDANNRGDHRWASARYARFAMGNGDGLSPRDCAMFAYHPDSAI